MGNVERTDGRTHGSGRAGETAHGDSGLLGARPVRDRSGWGAGKRGGSGRRESGARPAHSGSVPASSPVYGRPVPPRLVGFRCRLERRGKSSEAVRTGFPGFAVAIRSVREGYPTSTWDGGRRSVGHRRPAAASRRSVCSPGGDSVRAPRRGSRRENRCGESRAPVSR